MSQRLCVHCRQPLQGRQRKYCAACASLASLLWNRARRREWKACQRPNEPPYWRDGWKNRTDAERKRYIRDYMREYRQGLRRRTPTFSHQCPHCTNSLATTATLAVALIAGFLVTACTSPATSQADTAPDRHLLEATTSMTVSDLNLRPEHEQILAATGWLDFVEANIDLLEYYPWEALATRVGPAWGIASYDNGRRVAHIATAGRDNRAVVATIVHEAAHLAGIREVGDMYDQRHAEALEALFLLTYDALDDDTSDDGSSQPAVFELRIEIVPSPDPEHERSLR